MAGLPIDGGRTIGFQDLVGLVQAGRFHIDYKGRVWIDGRQVAGQHQADLVGEDFLARIIDHAAAITVTVETEREVGTGFLHLGGHLYQHGVVFGVRIIFGEGPVEIGIHLDHFHAHTAQGLGGKGTGGTIATGRDDAQRTLDLRLGGDVGDIGFGKVFDVGQGATGTLDTQTAQHDFLQAAHLIGAEGQGLVRAHLHAGPAVFVMTGGDHGHAGAIKGELGEIGGRRQGQTDIQHLHPALQQADRQGLFDGDGIGTEIVTDDDFRFDILFVHIGGKAQTQCLNTQKVDFLLQNPARIIFTKTCGLDESLGLIGRRIGLQVLTGCAHGKSVGRY